MEDPPAGKDDAKPAVKKESSHAAFAKMENVVDKLKVLNYEELWCQAKGAGPLSRWHFAMPAANASVQFALFLDISSWLMTVATDDPTFFRIDKFDDPNTSVNKMMLSLRKLEFGLDFPASKLKTANGDAVVDVLDFLTDKALSAKDFQWGKPIYAEENDMEEAEADDEADVGEIVDDVDVVEEQDAIFSEAAEVGEASIEQSTHQMIAGSIDPVDWQARRRLAILRSVELFLVCARAAPATGRLVGASSYRGSRGRLHRFFLCEDRVHGGHLSRRSREGRSSAAHSRARQRVASTTTTLPIPSLPHSSSSSHAHAVGRRPAPGGGWGRPSSSASGRGSR